MDAQILEFRGKKTNIKRKLTLIEKYLRENSENFEIEGVQVQVNKINDIDSECKDLFEKWTILVLEDVEKLEECEKIADEIEARCVVIKSELKKILKTFNTDDSNEGKKNALDSREKHVDKPRVKLPEIQLPKFDGSLEQWISFRDIFNAMIIDNESMPSVQKFVYLNGCLTGEAKKLVDKISLSEHGFELAWNALLDRYNQKRLIIYKHISELFKSKPVEKNSYKDLRNLIDDCQLHYRALQSLSQPVDHWDMVIIYFVIQRLDEETRKLWETASNEVEDIAFEDLVQFLSTRCNVLQSIDSSLKNKPNVSSHQKSWSTKQDSKSKTFFTSKNDHQRCRLCNESHLISSCKKFLSLTPKMRFEKIKEFGLCLKCFGSFHGVSRCSRPSCKICRMNHHDLLHFPKDVDKISSVENKTSSSNNVSNSPTLISAVELSADKSVSMSCKSKSENSSKQVILPTAVILIADAEGKFHECRALLDSASQSNLMSKQLAIKLNLDLENASSTVFGLNNLAVPIRKKVKSVVRSRIKEFGKKLHFLVVTEISNCLPNESFDISQWNLPNAIPLADDLFNLSSRVDVLLGAEIFFEVLQSKKHLSSPGTCVLQDTEFGYVASGLCQNLKLSHCFFLSNTIDNEDTLDQQVRSFWEIESCEDKKVLTAEEKQCEEVFDSTFRRNEDGRFVVSLPFKDSYKLLGNSRDQALKRFRYLEAKLMKNPDLKTSYCKFMEEYEALGHMSLCQTSHPSNEEFFLPHHAVFRPESTTTKTRVVFDASAPSSTTLSLNNVLMVGPQLQCELFDLVLRFRLYNIVFTADIEKMYRQILVDPKQTQYQKILWRDSPEKELQEYQLETVTYGTSSAPYLATKVLQQISKEVESTLPVASRVIANDFYMDDLLSGTNTVEEAITTIDEVTSVLQSAGMNLRKWSSNCPLVLSNIDDQHKSSSSEPNNTIKTLGLRWDPSADSFSFDVTKLEDVTAITKRTVLSDVARLFDPLGMLAPVVINAKMFIQKLWVQQLQWDEDLPAAFCDEWIDFRGKLECLSNILFSRSMFGNVNDRKDVEVHGFADASQFAYGACLYIHFEDANGEVFTNLLCSKSRVAPLKTTTIPRLELNAALLLAKLVSRVKKIMPELFRRCFLWIDSSIVLAYLKRRPQELKLYVANRVAEIQEITTDCQWRHVNSKSNAADVLSRGISPDELKNCSIWWYGPEFLKLTEDNWPNKFIDTSKVQLPELKKEDAQMSFVTVVSEDVFNVARYSSLVKLSRIAAYVLRYIRHLKEVSLEVKSRGAQHRDEIHAERKLYRCLDAAELENALVCIVKNIQRVELKPDIQHLEKHNRLPDKSSLWKLSPFVDDQGVLRVGGRLQNSSIAFDQKHQLLVPKHHLANLIVDFYHKENLHAGVQTTLSSIRQKYWLLDGRNVTRNAVHRCLKCFRNKPIRLEQMMGNLPSSRIDGSRPFDTTGVDLCGPFFIRYPHQRKDTVEKIYVCVFICFWSKSIHLECIDDLTSDAFIDGLKRFIARRGNVTTIWSDNATNFIGSRNELERLQEMYFKDNKIIDFATTRGITWKFIPPRSPHFGGLWESAVRLFKLHFKKLVGSTVLLASQFSSLVTQIEGILNSRPLTALSNDPVDLEPLTPGHFLTGGPINAIVEMDKTSIPDNRLKLWEKAQKIRQLFQKRFSLEYIHTLQQRDKWQRESPNLKCDDIVLVVDENQPSSKWLLGKITEVVLGKDNKVRVASVRTKNGVIKRVVHKLAKLPIN